MRWFCTLLFALGTLAVTARAGGESRTNAEFPFEFREGFIWIKVTSPESPTPLNFIFDSGAAVSTINSDAAQRLGLHSGERVTVKGVGSSTVGYWPQPFTAAINDLRLPRRYLVVDLCKLQASCQCRVDGLLGADFMDGRVVQVDFEARKIRLLRSTQNVIGETIELKKRRDVWQVPLRVNGSATAWFRLDTGCASGLQWVTGTSGPQPTSTKISVALTEMSLPVTETTVNAGTTTVTGVSTTLHRSELFSGEAGLVGAGFLSRFSVVTLDAKANRLILTPRSAE